MRRLFQYLKSYKKQLGFSMTYSIGNKILDLMPPLLVGWIVDTVSGSTPGWIIGLTGTKDPWSLALFISVMIVVIFGAESFFEWLYKRGFMRLAQDVQHDLRLDAYQRLQRREIAYFEKQRTGNLMAMLNGDVNQLERFLNTGFNDILQMAVLIIFAGITLWAASWEMALVGMAPIPILLIGSFYYQRAISPHYQNIRGAVGHLSNRLENNISGILVIKSFTAEDYEAKRVEEASAQYKKVNYGAIRLSAAFVPLIRMFIAVGLAVAMLMGAYWILNGYDKLTVGELTFFAMMIQRLLWPITRLGQIFDGYERASASARRVFGLMDSPNQIPDTPNPVQVVKANGHVQFNNVQFEYGNGLKILKGLNLNIPQGQTIGFAGTTGAGKTTLVKLLLRLYDVTGGSITVDGNDLRDFEKSNLRRQLALVSQDVYLFHGTVADNIAYGMENVTLKQIEQAAKQAQLHDFITSLPDAYQAMVGERGIKLSGGQRQRLSIARAILKDAPILILDEATSSVDTETERAIQENLNELTQGKTALIIAHRLSTIRQADQIAIIHEGKIAELGTHDELLDNQGIYADLWAVQTGDVRG